MNTGLSKESAHLQDLHRRLISDGTYPSCLNCEHCAVNQPGRPRQPQGPLCTLYQATPPPDVIVYGCDNWIIDIPF